MTGRPKHYYSIYQKMIHGGREFSDIYDLVGIRILVDSDPDCYGVLGVLHNRWNPLPGRFKDYVAMPKFNMYQSLHTTVIGPSGQAGRDADPHHRRCTAARSTASRRTGSTRRTCAPASTPSRPTRPTSDMQWLRQLLDWQHEVEDPGEFLDSLRFEINSAEVFVFTPRAT